MPRFTRGFNSLYLLHPYPHPPWGYFVEKWYNILTGPFTSFERASQFIMDNHSVENTNNTPIVEAPSNDVVKNPPLSWWRRFRLRRWHLVVLAAVLYGGVFLWNSHRTFKVSNNLDHQGPWYRQVGLAVRDSALWADRHFQPRYDWLGRPSVVYTVNGRTFLQKETGKPAVEVYSTK